MEDFPAAAKRLLNLIEWWLCLVMPQEEIDNIARFRSLTDEQRTLLRSAMKEPGKFVEGVVLADQITALFRSVVPPIVLALAQTEQDEKANRARVMREQGLSELQAVEWIARRIAEGRR